MNLDASKYGNNPNNWRYSCGFVGEQPFQIRVDWVAPETTIQFKWDDKIDWVDTPFQAYEFRTMDEVIHNIEMWINEVNDG